MSILSEVTQLVDGVDVVSAKDIMDTQETAISAMNKADEALDKANNMSGGNEYDDTELRGLIDGKANLDASNLSTSNVESWKEKLGVGDALHNVLHIDVLYDMRDDNKNLQMSTGIPYQSDLSLDMRKYKFVKAFARWGTNAHNCGILDLTNDFAEYNNTCQTCISSKSISSSDSDTYWFIVSSSTDKRTLHIEKAGYDTFTERKTCGENTTLNAFITRLEGWY